MKTSPVDILGVFGCPDQFASDSTWLNMLDSKGGLLDSRRGRSLGFVTAVSEILESSYQTG